MAENKEKLVITAFNQAEDGKGATTEIGTFTAMFNPQTLNFKKEIEYEVADSDQKKTLKFKSYKPQQYDFEFIFDGTGTSGNELSIEVGGKLIKGDGQNDAAKKGKDGQTLSPDLTGVPSYLLDANGKEVLDKRAKFVSEAVTLFEELTAGYVREKHMAPILKLNWGPLNVQVILKTMDVTYDLFNKQGGPLRARVKCSFLEFETADKIQASLKPASPDMTHKRIALDGETLPLMTKRIYGDPKYYLEIARINNLSNFRKLKAGQELFFPPIDKLN